MKNNILAVLLSGLVLFFWGFISWTVLPWHNATANQFTDEAKVAQVLRENAPKAGVYYLPFVEEDHRPGEAAAFVNVLPNGLDSGMGKMMSMGLIGQWLSAILVLCLLKMTSRLGYGQRVQFVALTGLIIGFASHFPYWNWFGFSTAYVTVIILDTLIAWLLAGLVLAKFETGKLNG